MSNRLIGLGLRHPHYQQVLAERPAVGWFEVHSENFFQQGGPAIDILCALREHYPLSLHGVGLSLGSVDGIQRQHLMALKQLITLVEPFKVSEHLSWSRVGHINMPDLLPLPYNAETLEIFCANISQAQEFLGRAILIENPSSYIEFAASDQAEADFLVTLCQRSGAKILLDVNNVFISCANHGWNAHAYIDAIPAALVEEIHLAGHTVKTIAPDQIVRIDTHDHPVCAEVWDLYGYAIASLGHKHTLLEWDAAIPELTILINEAAKAEKYLSTAKVSHANA